MANLERKNIFFAAATSDVDFPQSAVSSWKTTQRVEAKSTSNCWGKRKSMFPDGSSFLALGNSHTQQASEALLCHHAMAVSSYRPFEMPEARANRIGFANRVSVVTRANSPLVCSNI
jgi:hypothetical protein